MKHQKSVTSVYNALHREKLCNHCIQVWRWKKSDDSVKKVWQVYTNALHREKLYNHCIQVWRWKKIWWLWKKVWQVYTNALHREKLCNHCIQVWQQTEMSCHKRIYGTNIFWWSTKKAWQVYTMHYIGKSYVTTIYKCGDGKKSDDSEKKSVTSVYKCIT